MKKIEWASDADLEDLSLKEVTRRLMDEPETVVVTLPEIARLFQMSGDELKEEMTSGRLVVMGNEMPGGWTRVHVTARHLREWMVLTGRTIPSAN